METHNSKIGAISFLFCLYLNVGWAQNLVPNPSFEQYYQCPYEPNQVSFIVNWNNPTDGSPEYYNACNSELINVSNMSVPDNISGYQEAYSGEEYVGLYMYSFGESNIREYIQAKLNAKLVKRKKYFIGFYCNLRDNYCNMAANNWGAFLSIDPIHRNDMQVIDTTAQLINHGQQLVSKTDWMLVSDTIESEGDEEYITIGNFFSDSLTDTISLIDTNWIYWVYKKPYYFIDDVFVIPLDSLTSITEPKPLEGNVFVANNYLVLQLKESYKPISIAISNSMGQTVWQQKEFYTQGERRYGLPPLAGGLYFVEVSCGGGVLREKILVSGE